MPYATVDDFVMAFGEDEAIALSNLDDPTALDQRNAVIEAGLEGADSMIDGYIQSAGYTMPLSSVPAVLKEIALDIARYRLDRLSAREDVRLRYEDALKWLRDVSAGKVSLGLATNGEEVTASGSCAIEYYASESVFSRESLRDY